MVTNDPVSICGRGSSGVRASNLSVKIIVHTLEETLSQIHIANWVDGLLEYDTARELTISVAPVVLDTLKMPLVNNNNNSLSL